MPDYDKEYAWQQYTKFATESLIASLHHKLFVEQGQGSTERCIRYGAHFDNSATAALNWWRVFVRA